MKLAIDLGTTTIAISLTDTKTGLRMEEVLLNQQRFFGTDILSRIKASTEGKKEMLQTLIQKCLLQGIRAILKKSGASPKDIENITIAANTTMVYLLLGYSCESLGAYPFSTVTFNTLSFFFKDIFNDTLLSCMVTILPGISAFVGGDIVSGIYYTDMDLSNELSFLLDLGTNGEMVLGNKDKLLTSSAAAGPAFEGGKIKYGMAAIKGAIYQVAILEEKVKFKTLQYGRPLGLCGSGIIDLTSELLQNNYMDSTGLLREPYFEKGFPVTHSSGEMEGICFYQKDIREVQMAKSAIYTGILLLCKEYGCQPEEIKNIYLSGTFGSSANLQHSISIGLLPSVFRNKIKVLGNSSLLGSIKYAMEENSRERISSIQKKSDVILLANLPEFETLYIENMNF